MRLLVADSPMFSTLVAWYAPPESRGATLTIVNCLGFALTIGSVQLTGWLAPHLPPQLLLLPLALGPALGLWALWRGRRVAYRNNSFL